MSTAGLHSNSISGYVFKIATRCNLNCTYCYMYNLADSGWRRQPKRMALSTVQKTAERMREHCVRHGRKKVQITLHGGEPFLVGVDQMRDIVRTLRRTLEPAGIRCRITVQSNGLLFSSQFGDMLTEEGVTLGISVDGPPNINDLHRVDHRGRGSSARLEKKLELLSRDYRSMFAGLLCVVNVDACPEATFDYLASFDPPTINFLLPVDNHDRLPPGMTPDGGATLYGDWLCTAFERWAKSPKKVRVLFFNSIINLLLGGSALTESHGTEGANLVVIEANGDIEAVDSLKGAYEGAATLGLNVFDHDFDAAARRILQIEHELGARSVADKCAICPMLDVCGGGDMPTRYAKTNGFRDPSIYCRDLQKIIARIDSRIAEYRQRPARFGGVAGCSPPGKVALAGGLTGTGAAATAG